MHGVMLKHELAAAIRVEDHFLGTPVPEELRVQLLVAAAPPRGFELATGRPVRTPDGASTRHADGTYRFADVESGRRYLRIESPSGRWTRWGAPPVEVELPLADRRHALAVEMWPTTAGRAPAAVTAIRGKVLGPGGASGTMVRIEPDGRPPRGRYTFTDALGQFLFPVACDARLDPIPASPYAVDGKGRIKLVASVVGAALTGIEVNGIPAATTPSFTVTPGRTASVHLLT